MSTQTYDIPKALEHYRNLNLLEKLQLDCSNITGPTDMDGITHLAWQVESRRLANRGKASGDVANDKVVGNNREALPHSTTKS